MIRLGVNIDHVATLRQARETRYPSPIQAALSAHMAGADLITFHLREDRRHIQDEDVYLLAQTSACPLNFEMAMTDEMLCMAEKIKPSHICLVPEKREELTTEGGLDVCAHQSRIRDCIDHLSKLGIRVSLFVDPQPYVLEQSARLGADCVELHTGDYAASQNFSDESIPLQQLRQAATEGRKMGLRIHGGHGLTLCNVAPIAAIPEIEELNIGHALVADALFLGWHDAIVRMKQTILMARIKPQSSEHAKMSTF